MAWEDPRQITEEFFEDVKASRPDSLDVSFNSFVDETKMTVWLEGSRRIPFDSPQMFGFKTGKAFWDFVRGGIESLTMQPAITSFSGLVKKIDEKKA